MTKLPGRVLIPCLQMLASTADAEERDCSWFSGIMFGCKESFTCEFKLKEDGPALHKMTSPENGCELEEDLPDGLKLQCTGLMSRDRANVKDFYFALMDHKASAFDRSYSMSSNKIGHNPVQLMVDSGDCTLTRDGVETRADLDEVYRQSYYFKYQPEPPPTPQ